MFEVQDLRYATLATVSRCGMVWFSEDVLSTEMIFENHLARLRTVPVEEAEEETRRIRAPQGGDVLSPTLQVSGESFGNRHNESNDFNCCYIFLHTCYKSYFGHAQSWFWNSFEGNTPKISTLVFLSQVHGACPKVCGYKFICTFITRALTAQYITSLFTGAA